MVTPEKIEAITLENSSVMADFAAKGVDLSQRRDFKFGVELSSKAQCQLFSKLFFERYEAEIHSDAVRMIEDHGDQFEFGLYVEILPSVEEITKVECQLLTVAEDFDDAEVYWYFKE
ncbi:ribonuclease E inhibitor RraB [Roseibium sp. MMSF_3412]|uniref:ribonuclease E inhibitor RraB n=1 Tax=Roseibium sp. MMSF_3412 TaxID=3046712 RepID=UPI00273D6111|nr:ribonuclease E inhibitor RraB [Roseibium sp. MMSF_3412]